MTNNNIADAGFNGDLVAANGKLYHLGNSGSVYDPTTNAWSTINSFTPVNDPFRRGESALTALNNQLYQFGGRTLLNVETGDVISYNTTNDTWAILSANTVQVTSYSGITVAAGKIYVFGGSATGMGQKFSVYDPTTNSWAIMSDVPNSYQLNYGPIALTRQNKIYLFAGTSIYNYDPSSGAWGVTGINSPEPNTRAMGVINNEIYMVAWDATGVGYCLFRFIP